jgi:carbamoyl-phosphate synthase large subunit
MGKRKLNIAVTGLNAVESPGPGISVIRGLHEASSFDARIIGLSYEPLEPGIYMHDLVSRSYQIPYPATGTDTLLSRLEYIHNREGIDVIIPNFDAEMLPFILLEPKLKKLGIHMFLPTRKQFEDRQKFNLMEFGEKHGIHVPKSKVIYDLRSLQDVLPEFSYPLVVKGKFYDTFSAHNSEQVKTGFSMISAKWGVPVIIQDFINGIELNVTGLGDGKGRTLAAVPMRKQYVTDKGKAWGGISIADKELLNLTNEFVRSTKWKGGFELELIKTRDNRLYLIEINPRLPAWIYLAVGCGQNIPEALVRLALGLKVEPYRQFNVGKMFVRYSWDMIIEREEFENISINGEL